ncbi:YnfU family zinc-binding protein [Citrobacter murliniae]
MSYTDGLRQFKERPVHVTCPVCAHIADQKAGKMRKDAVSGVPCLRAALSPVRMLVHWWLTGIPILKVKGKSYENQKSCFY